MKLTKRETATVLAALRNWQQDLQEGGLIPREDFPHHFESDEPLNTKEIDDLCRRINFQGEGDLMEQSPIFCPRCHKPADVIDELQWNVAMTTTYSWDGEGFVEVSHEEDGGDRELQCRGCGKILPFDNQNQEESNCNVLFNFLK